MRILCANVGSTSFKYQIIDMTTEASLVKGCGGTHLEFAIGVYHTPVPGKPARAGEIDAPTHIDAIAHAMNLVTDAEVGCMAELGELDGVGFKTILAKGYWRSARITEDVIAALDASTPLAPDAQPRLYRFDSRLSGIASDAATCRRF